MNNSQDIKKAKQELQTCWYYYNFYKKQYNIFSNSMRRLKAQETWSTRDKLLFKYQREKMNELSKMCAIYKYNVKDASTTYESLLKK